MTSALPACVSMTQCVCVCVCVWAHMCRHVLLCTYICRSVGVGLCTFTRDHVLVCAFPLQ